MDRITLTCVTLCVIPIDNTSSTLCVYYFIFFANSVYRFTIFKLVCGFGSCWYTHNCASEKKEMVAIICDVVGKITIVQVSKGDISDVIGLISIVQVNKDNICDVVSVISIVQVNKVNICDVINIFSIVQVNKDDICAVGQGLKESSVTYINRDIVLETLKDNMATAPSLKWQYFASEQGVLFSYPTLKYCSETYDPRFRFVHA